MNAIAGRQAVRTSTIVAVVHFLLPYVRLELLIRTMLTRTWAPEAWPLVKRAHPRAPNVPNSSPRGLVELTSNVRGGG